MNLSRCSIAYYISAHGYGHGVRSCDIIRAVHDLFPQIEVHVVSDLPPEFLINRIGSARCTIRRGALDIGMVQVDSIRVDVRASLVRVEQLLSKRKELVAQESDFIRRTASRLVVVDIPAMPLEAAAIVGVPCMAVGNFGWDWIYSGFAAQDPRWAAAAALFSEQYARAQLLLRLPFSESMSAFPHVEDIPLVASSGKNRRSEIAALTGCNPEKRWILLSFTTLDWDEDSLSKIEQLSDYEFFTVRPLFWNRTNIHPLDRGQVLFSDAVASVDAVISKPGFGILSDCIVNDKPLIYSDRSDFLEYAVLEDAIKKYLKHLHIPSSDLYRGNLKPGLEGIWSRPQAIGSMGRGGDVIAARRIAQMAGFQP